MQTFASSEGCAIIALYVPYRGILVLPRAKAFILTSKLTYAVVALDQARHQSNVAPGPEPDGDDGDADPSLGLLLHYHLPPELVGSVEPGHLVVVPLRTTPMHGVVVELAESAPVITKPVMRVVDPNPVLTAAMLSLARWIAAYYRCTLWQAISPMLPPGVARRAVTNVGLSIAGEAGAQAKIHPLTAALGRRQQQVVSLLQHAPRSTLTLSKLKRRYHGPQSGLDTALRTLERDGVVTRQTTLPSPRSKPQKERIIRLAVSPDDALEEISKASQRAPLQAAVLDWLVKRAAKGVVQKVIQKESSAPPDGWHLLRDLYLHTGANASTVAAIEKKGFIEMSDRAIYRKPVPRTAASPGDEAPSLTSAQSDAWRQIADALRNTFAPTPESIQNSKLNIQNYLLHGVTGSGKTEIYLRAIGMALRMGRQAIVLVPEISLTPQAVHRFATRFPGRVALVHSQLSAGQQFDEWRRIQGGQADIVVGSRSAVFAPLPRLGLIVVDEEHEWAYKQDNVPRYHARDVALKRAELTGDCMVILGSATPDLVTYHKAQQGEYGLLSLPTRVGRRRARDGSELTLELPMPQVQVVDMRAELRASNHSLFSRALQTAMQGALDRKEQAILYLNRRGSSSFFLCRECGHVPLCRRCDVPLVYHADVYGMICHRCNAYSLTFRECPACGSSDIKGFGTGTQKVVDEVANLFPGARVLRWDRDTASRSGGHSGLMDLFVRGEADVLVGTQMIAKGLDIARVTLVGVVNADTGLFMPDFRAPERTLQLLMQVAGRAGRRAETTHSRVVVQTYNPEHYAIQAAAAYDYKGFYTGEIRFRAEHGYPPYGQLARLVYTASNNERCEQATGAVARYLRRRAEELAEQEEGETSGLSETDVLGPAPCFVHKIRGRYRWQILIRSNDVHPLLHDFQPGPGWSIDVDPMSVL